ncbi:MarR family winged helix-turn-helix transcriptional regulator [Polaromonas sp. JS666]|uniref:MarR family winged helix-turn-helix transcriptional regulator n=1 Tax=Polaromonas sp. (strain JS666 / ATCC BAA-500) TaxID=296591 RepID=UPI0008872BC5|nr:MarR family transcriptional regulator [Polaromonas sp. JS666]SDM79693.1 DNA-binding transcriptional regulator, MarR family [Polaromonas sp. JS666]
MSNDTQNIIRHWREAVPNDRLAHLIRDASRAFHRALQVRLARHGVPFGHWTFLRILWESDGLTQKELSERAGVMEPTTFTAMKAMEALGYIERKQLPTNKKNMYVYLSDKGRALKQLLVPLAEETNNVSIEGIEPEHIKMTRTVLLAMIENLARDELLQEKAAPARRKAAARGEPPEKTEKVKITEKKMPGNR